MLLLLELFHKYYIFAFMYIILLSTFSYKYQAEIVAAFISRYGGGVFLYDVWYFSTYTSLIIFILFSLLTSVGWQRDISRRIFSADWNEYHSLHSKNVFRCNFRIWNTKFCSYSTHRSRRVPPLQWSPNYYFLFVFSLPLLIYSFLLSCLAYFFLNKKLNHISFFIVPFFFITWSFYISLLHIPSLPFRPIIRSANIQKIFPHTIKDILQMKCRNEANFDLHLVRYLRRKETSENTEKKDANETCAFFPF